MKQKSRHLKKLFSIALCAALIGGTALALPVVSSDSSIVASAAEYGDFDYEVTDDNTITLTRYKGKGGAVTLPAAVNGKKVTEIGTFCFCNCDTLTSITIPDSVTAIGDSAFKLCTSLTSITIPDSVTSLQLDTFKECKNLKNVTISKNIAEIPYFTFMGCSSLTSITFPDGVESIMTESLADCTGLQNVTIPESVAWIEEDVFKNCDLKNLTIYGDGGSVAEEYAVEHGIRFVDRSVFKNVSVISEAAEVGTPITLYAIPAGGKGPYTYALMYKKSTSDTWTKIGKKYGTQNTGSFTPGKAVKYDIQINVKDSTGKTKSKSFTVDVKTPLKNNTTVNAETVKVGEKIVLKGAASGGSGGYQYAFYYKKSKSTKWTEMKPAYTTKSAAFKPGTVTDYDVKSIVKDAYGRTTEKIYNVKVTK